LGKRRVPGIGHHHPGPSVQLGRRGHDRGGRQGHHHLLLAPGRRGPGRRGPGDRPSPGGQGVPQGPGGPMTTSFDFHTLSVTIDKTPAEYNRARVPGPLGLHLYEVVQGDRSKILRFRHEHAHFTSFLATGLADLYGVFSDYTLALLYAYVHRQMTGDGAAALTLPLIMPCEEGSPAHGPELRRAWDQVTNLQAFLFGFGTSATVPALVDTGPQDDFWAAHFDLCFSRIVQRFYRLLESLATDAGTAYPGGRALPLITVPH